MNDILLLGAGGHARSCIDVLEQEKKYSIAGMVEQRTGEAHELIGYPFLGEEDTLPRFRKKIEFALVCIGQIKDPRPRMVAYTLLRGLDFILPFIVSPFAYVSPHAKIGDGTIIMHGAIINAGAIVGDNCIINSQSLIEHDATVSNHCHISTGAKVNGGARIGEGSFIGSGTVVREYVNVGEYMVVSANSFVSSEFK